MERMRVFVSWSGPVARAVAKVWVDLIEETFDAVDAFMSDRIEAGLRGLDDIKDALDETRFAVVIVTPENENASWLNFEAGAISKQIPGDPITKVVPCLVNYSSPSQLTGPLIQFQGKLLNKEEVGEILSSLATSVDIPWARKQRQFERAWEDRFFDEFETARTSDGEGAGDGGAKSNAPIRTAESMFEEILELLREDRRLSSYSPMRMPGKRLMEQIAEDTYDFVNNFVRNNCEIYLGLNYDPDEPTGFELNISSVGVNENALRKLTNKIVMRKPITRLNTGTDSHSYEAATTSQWRHTISYTESTN